MKNYQGPVKVSTGVLSDKKHVEVVGELRKNRHQKLNADYNEVALAA